MMDELMATLCLGPSDTEERLINIYMSGLPACGVRGDAEVMYLSTHISKAFCLLCFSCFLCLSIDYETKWIECAYPSTVSS